MKNKHWILMLLCCLVPIVGLGAVYLLNIPVKTVLYVGLILLCPLSHVVMMIFMGREHASETQHHIDRSQNQEPPLPRRR